MGLDSEVLAPVMDPVKPETSNEADKESVVKIIGKSRVLPAAERLDTKECPLITFDLPYITFYYNQKLLVYKGGEYEVAVEKLKDSLSAVLEHFPPLAGKLGKNEEGVLRVECEGESLLGAEVIEAAAEEVEVSELAGDNAPSFLQQLVPYSGVMNLEGLNRPLLAVQFTKLKDGLAVGCAFNHAVLDGHSTWQFMGAWAELSRGASSVSVQPFHDRAQARSARLKLSLPESAAAHEKDDPAGAAKPLRDKIFSFSENSVEKLKAAANAGLAEGAKPLSTFQSLGDHVWRAVCRARRLKPEDITVFAIFIDCRKRVDPPMPDGYFGNMVQAIFNATAAGLLLASPTVYGATLLQQVIDVHDAKAIDARLKEYEAAPKMFYFRDAGINCVAVGSSPRFPVYEVDFGFGKPERVRSGSNNRFDGMVYLYAGRDGGKSIDAEISLDAEAMENLEKDDEFLNV
ncbi:HXXXD-type acyl-transferase family protein [Wolffia australiana]